MTRVLNKIIEELGTCRAERTTVHLMGSPEDILGPHDRSNQVSIVSVTGMYEPQTKRIILHAICKEVEIPETNLGMLPENSPKFPKQEEFEENNDQHEIDTKGPRRSKRLNALRDNQNPKKQNNNQYPQKPRDPEVPQDPQKPRDPDDPKDPKDNNDKTDTKKNKKDKKKMKKGSESEDQELREINIPKGINLIEPLVVMKPLDFKKLDQKERKQRRMSLEVRGQKENNRKQRRMSLYVWDSKEFNNKQRRMSTDVKEQTEFKKKEAKILDKPSVVKENRELRDRKERNKQHKESTEAGPQPKKTKKTKS